MQKKIIVILVMTLLITTCTSMLADSLPKDGHIKDLSENWNLIGLPYKTSVPKDNLTIYYDGTDYNWTEAVDSSIIIGFIYNWNETGQNYEFTDVLNPGDGYWVYAYFECVLFNSDIPSEICDDEIDNDDDDLIDCEDPDCMLDEDNDGYYSIPCGDDCNDTNYDVNPGVVEICDEIDNDCDDLIDEDFTYFLDFDDDGYGNPLISIVDCNEQPEGYVVDNTDCNDTDPDVNPGHPEICDGKDNDCDDVIPSDESDVDGDNWMICEGDCDDNDPQMYPGAEEVCDGKDNDCDSETDEDVVDCDDDNCCTDDYCFDSNCINDPISGIPCDDGDPCTIEDVCVDGECIGTPIDCNDDNYCTEDICIEGECFNIPVPNGQPCDDDNECTVNDVCENGECIGTPIDCNDDNECTIDNCNPSTGECVYIPVPNGQPCDDGDPNTIDDECIDGECIGTPIKNINVYNEKGDGLNKGIEVTSFNLFDSYNPFYFSWNSNLNRLYYLMLFTGVLIY